MTINLHKILTTEQWPKSIVEDDILKVSCTDLMPYLYPVDQTTSFFIPATAIMCKMDDTIIVCEGVYYCKEDQIRIDALNQKTYFWLWLQVKV